MNFSHFEWVFQELFMRKMIGGVLEKRIDCTSLRLKVVQHA